MPNVVGHLDLNISFRFIFEKDWIAGYSPINNLSNKQCYKIYDNIYMTICDNIYMFM